MSAYDHTIISFYFPSEAQDQVTSYEYSSHHISTYDSIHATFSSAEQHTEAGNGPTAVPHQDVQQVDELRDARHTWYSI